MSESEAAIVALLKYLHKNAGRTANFPIQLVMKEREATKLAALIQEVNRTISKAEKLK